jgi:hypothetical protein
MMQTNPFKNKQPQIEESDKEAEESEEEDLEPVRDSAGS